jgi:hypothetical protein
MHAREATLVRNAVRRLLKEPYVLLAAASRNRELA